MIEVAGGWHLRTNPENVGVGVAPGRGQAAAADARDAGDAVDRRLPPADHAPGDRRHARRRLRPGAEDAARSRAGAHDRQEGGGRAADPLRDDAGVSAHLQPDAISPSCRRCASSTSWARRRWRRSTPRRRCPATPRAKRRGRQAGAAAAPRELDPEEDDELLTELERAAAAAAKAADGDRGPTSATARRRRTKRRRRRARNSAACAYKNSSPRRGSPRAARRRR